jgi:hypothetical protein
LLGIQQASFYRVLNSTLTEDLIAAQKGPISAKKNQEFSIGSSKQKHLIRNNNR